MPAGRRLRGRGRTQAGGFTIVEVMAAAVVLVLGITTSILTLQSGLQAMDTARHFTVASQVMQSELERLRLKSWSQLQALEDSGDTAVAIPNLGAGSGTFTCTRAINDLRDDMKEIILIATWHGYDGRSHTVRFMTRYGKTGLYDYFYTAH